MPDAPRVSPYWQLLTTYASYIFVDVLYVVIIIAVLFGTDTMHLLRFPVTHSTKIYDISLFQVLVTCVIVLVRVGMIIAGNTRNNNHPDRGVTTLMVAAVFLLAFSATVADKPLFPRLIAYLAVILPSIVFITYDCITRSYNHDCGSDG